MIEQGTIAVRDGWDGARGRVRLAAAGDLMMGTTTAEMVAQKGPRWPFELVRDDFRDADVALVNIECTISDIGEFTHWTGSSLRAPSSMMEILADLGVNAATIANNHIMDEGPDALRATIDNLAAGGIKTFGAGMNAQEAWRPGVVEANGMKIGMIGFVDYERPTAYAAGPDTPGAADLNAGGCFEAVEALRGEVDLVVAVGHGDWEFYPYPSPRRVEYARGLVDAGARLVLMHHPHVPQGVEAYGGGLIAYSLGNFMFPADGYIRQGSPWTDRSFYLLIDIDDHGPTGATIKPFRTTAEARNIPLEGQEAQDLLAHVADISAAVADDDFMQRYAHAVWFQQLWVHVHVAKKTHSQRGNPLKVDNNVNRVCRDMLYPDARPEFEARMAKYGPPDLKMIEPELWLDP